MLWPWLVRNRPEHLRHGRRGERVAARFLRRGGYRLLARNTRSRLGEIDLVAQAPDGRTIVFIEVKAGRGQQPRPEVRVNRDKQRKLTALAANWLRTHRLTERPVRFDIIGIDLPDHGRPEIRHHPHAFESHV